MKLPAVLFLLLYLSATLRPVWPVLADTLAHVFWHHEHIETVHKNHGAQHVHQELKTLATGLEDSNSSAPLPVKSSKTNESVAPHLATFTWNISLPTLSLAPTQPAFHFLFPVTSCSLNLHTPPPKGA
jgi:hypothetical protein